MLRSRNFYIRLSIALFVVGASLLVIPPYLDYCEHDYANEKYCTAYEMAAIFGAFLEAHNGAVTAIATAIIAWFTWSIRQVNQSQLAHGRQVERAYVNGGWGRYIDGRLYANINNDGKTPATVHHMVLAILPLADLPLTPPALPRIFVNYNLEPFKRDFFSDHVFVEWDGLHEPGRVLYGRFWYRDVFGEEHESGFLLHIQPRAPAVAGFPEYWRWT